MRYNLERWYVEVHYRLDVLCHEFRDESTAMRCVERMKAHLDWDKMREIRVWHKGKCLHRFDLC